jgi:hypothetical protein
VRVRPGATGVLPTRRAFRDVAVRFEFGLPPAAGRGVGVLFTGADPRATFQVYLAGGPEERQAVALRAAPIVVTASDLAGHGGYLRAPGDVNFLEVTLRGPRVTAELNGTVVLDADLADLPFAEGARDAGADRKEVHLGLCGYGDGVAFRSIAVKEL